jgi:hypothetical protein
MRSLEALEPLEWVNKVNRSWIVHNDLNQSADAWLRYLAGQKDGRLLKSCELARAMCRRRGPVDDPKPWFYAGLFHLATAEEAQRFLRYHRVTRATVPSMAGDEAVALWLDRANPETQALLDRLRNAFTEADLD